VEWTNVKESEGSEESQEFVRAKNGADIWRSRPPAFQNANAKGACFATDIPAEAGTTNKGQTRS
jgi:hypothetical protein